MLIFVELIFSAVFLRNSSESCGFSEESGDGVRKSNRVVETALFLCAGYQKINLSIMVKDPFKI